MLKFERISTDDIPHFISFLKDTEPDYPYRWFFDPQWVMERVNDENYIWGIARKRNDPSIIGTVLCHNDVEKKIAVLKLLFVHPSHRNKGILNGLFLDRINERRVIDEIMSWNPSLLFAEVLANNDTALKIVRKMGMMVLGRYPCKTVRTNTRLDLIPHAILFDKRHKTIDVDERIAAQVKAIIETNDLKKLRSLKIGRQKGTMIETCPTRIKKDNDKAMHRTYLIELLDGSTITFEFNEFSRTVTNVMLGDATPEAVMFFDSYVSELSPSYVEIMIPPMLELQHVAIDLGYAFTSYLPSYWNGEDVLTFSKWKKE